MAGNDLAFHYVCTREQGYEIAQQHRLYWVSECSCRRKRGGCARSRGDVCLAFRQDALPDRVGLREISLAEVGDLLQEAASKHLVVRPFRNKVDMAQTDGICFCCDDCCEYFSKEGSPCDKGSHIESTLGDACTHCGACVSVCFFGARKMLDGALLVVAERCYGCGLCVDVCPKVCIVMKPRV